MLFFSDPTIDLEVIIYSTLLAFFISVGIYVFTKKIFLALVLFSILTNIIFYGNMSYRFAAFYDVHWIFNFERNFWPYINIILFAILIISHIRNKRVKNK